MSASDRPPPQAGQRLVLVTGPSGAGRTTAIAALEDLGYEPIVNLPLSLVPRLLTGHIGAPLVLGVDVRNRDFATSNLIELIDWLTRNPDVQLEVLYMDARPDVLARRYSETRRRHPLAPGTEPEQGIAQEIDMLVPIRARAEVLIDTSEMTPHDLRAELRRFYDMGESGKLAVSVHSFSYKRGVPRGLDVMFDCRFLANPHWEAGLRALDGRDAAVADYVAADPRYAGFTQKVMDMLLFLLPAYVEEGKAHLSVGFGCTGGQHRSVAVTEAVCKSLAKEGWQVSKRHRELERKARGEAPSARTGTGG